MFSRRPGERFNRGRIATAAGAPGVFQAIFAGLSVESLMTTEPGMVQTSGANVTGATQQGACGFAWSASGTVTYTASDPLPGGLDNGTVTYGTTASRLTNAHTRVGPTTQPYYRAAVVRIPTRASGQRTLANQTASNNNQSLVHSAVVPPAGSNGLAGVNSSGGNPSFGMPEGEWVLVEQQFSGTNLITDVGQDHVRIRGLVAAGVSFGGATGRTGQSMGNGVGVQQKFYIEVNGKPTMAQKVLFLAEIERLYGSNVVRTPLNADTRLIVFETQSNGESQGVTGEVGPGHTHSTPLSAMTRTSPSADRNTCPLILRPSRTRTGTVPMGKWGYELQMMVDLKAASKEPRVIIKNSFSSSSMVEALASPIYPLVTSHFDEFDGELTGITKLFLVVDRGNTDATQGISQATAQTRYNALFADRIALAMAQCPSLVAAGVYIVSLEIGIDPAFIPQTLAVNLGRLDSLADQTGLGFNTIDITTNDMVPGAGGAHWTDAQNNTVGSRIATAIAAVW